MKKLGPKEIEWWAQIHPASKYQSWDWSPGVCTFSAEPFLKECICSCPLLRLACLLSTRSWFESSRISLSAYCPPRWQVLHEQGASQSPGSQVSHTSMHFHPPHSIPGFQKDELPQGTKGMTGAKQTRRNVLQNHLRTDSKCKLTVRPWERNMNSNPISIFMDEITLCIHSNVFNDRKKQNTLSNLQ